MSYLVLPLPAAFLMLLWLATNWCCGLPKASPTRRFGERLNWSKPTVGKWRQRFVERRLRGLYDELRLGRPRSVSDEQVAVLLRSTFKQKPAGATHWSVQLAAEANGLSESRL